MTDRVHISEDGRSVYHTCRPTPIPAAICRYFVKHRVHWTSPLLLINVKKTAVLLHGASTRQIQRHVIPEPRITLQGAATW